MIGGSLVSFEGLNMCKLSRIEGRVDIFDSLCRRCRPRGPIHGQFEGLEWPP
jgi:hypothetical protein